MRIYSLCLDDILCRCKAPISSHCVNFHLVQVHFALITNIFLLTHKKEIDSKYFLIVTTISGLCTSLTIIDHSSNLTVVRSKFLHSTKNDTRDGQTASWFIVMLLPKVRGGDQLNLFCQASQPYRYIILFMSITTVTIRPDRWFVTNRSLDQ